MDLYTLLRCVVSHLLVVFYVICDVTNAAAMLLCTTHSAGQVTVLEVK